MRGVTYQNQIAAVKAWHKVRIQRPPEMCSGKIGNAEQMRDGICPLTNQALNKCMAGSSGIFTFRRRGEPIGVELDVPDHLLGIHSQRTQRNAPASRMEFI